MTLCASGDGASCAGSGGWEQGWIIIIDPADPASVLQRQQGLPDKYLVSQAGGTAPISFQPIGVGATAASFTVCRDDPDGSQERVVTVSATGSARVTITNTGSCS
jgi:type IV fimbrial biogenesis protein FimT